jgi:mRNA-degrading endonuclease RelE of RelBE toxin-antitoxin system
MNVKPTDKVDKQLKKLPKNIQDKARKAFKQLSEDPYHPALNSKKMVGTSHFEARIDYHYRFIYTVTPDLIWVVAVGQHDEGLGKK